MRFLGIFKPKDLDELSNHINDGKKAFVLVYMLKCYHCDQVIPKWKEIENRMNEIENSTNIVVAHVEMSMINNQSKIDFGSIDGFPYIVHIHKKGKSVILPYENSSDIGPKDRSTDSFIRWIKKYGDDSVNDDNDDDNNYKDEPKGFEGGKRINKKNNNKNTNNKRKTRKQKSKTKKTKKNKTSKKKSKRMRTK